MQDLWNSWYTQKAIESNIENVLFSQTIHYPEGSSLVYHSLSYTNLVLISLIRIALGLPLTLTVLITLNNLMLLTSFIVGALGAFYLTKYFSNNFVASLIAGFIFSFSPFHIAHSLHHLHVATVQYIPFFVLLFLKFLSNKTMFNFVGAVVLFILAALSSFYYLFYNLLFMVFYYLYSGVRLRKLVVKGHLLGIASVALCSVLALAPLLLAMVTEGAGNERAYLGGHNTYVADVLGFVVFHPYHGLAAFVEPINVRLTGNAWEKSVYLGLVNVTLILWALISRNAFKISHYLFCMSGMAFFMLFAMGSSLHVGGRTFDILMPTDIMESIPFLRNIRTPSRAMVYVYLFISIATGLVVKHLVFSPQSYGYNRWIRSGILIVLSAVMFVDFYPHNLASTKVECPIAYENIRDDPGAFGIVDLPMSYVNGNRYMMYQICHEKPIVNATVSRKLNRSLSDYLVPDASYTQQRQLQDALVKYIVVHKDLISDRNRVDVDSYVNVYSTIYSDHRNIVFRVY
jgi:hypothetical protein